MGVPFLLFLTSAIAFAIVLTLPGLSDFVLLTGPAVLASLFLLLRALLRRKALNPGLRVEDQSTALFRRNTANPKWILIDGSNVMHWRDGTPQLDVLREVVGYLTERGYSPGIVFDANAGYLVSGKYQHHRAMGALLGLPEDRVMVVGKGSPADPVLLAAARDLGARIVTNDRYRDWAAAHPEVNTPGHLIKGAYRETGLWIDLEQSGEI